MKHNKWIRAIHLLRTDELSEQEQLDLNKHLSECTSCRTEAHNRQSDWSNFLIGMREEPQLPSPETLTENIMTAIASPPVSSSPRKTLFILDWLDDFFRPAVRGTLQLATLILLAIFLLEQVQMIQSIKAFEVTLQSQAGRPMNAGLSLLPETVRKRFLEKYSDQIIPGEPLSLKTWRSFWRVTNKILPLNKRILNKYFPELEQEALQALKDKRSPDEQKAPKGRS